MVSFKSTIFNQIMQYGKIESFENKVDHYKSDKGISKFRCLAILKIMIACQFVRLDKFREIQSCFAVNANAMYHLDLKSAKRSGLSYALKTRNSRVFEEHYYTLLEELKSKDRRKYRKILKILDSTTIGLCKSIFEWAEFRKTKSGIKIHILFDDRESVPVQAIMTNAKVHDVTVAKRITIEKGKIYVFDRGYNKYEYWHKIHENEAFFVTRLKKNAKIRVIESRRTGNKCGVIADKVIKITGTNKDSYDDEIRMIEYYDCQTDKRFKFVTNNFKMGAQEIADIYKRRWQIELFFKWMKQHFKVKKFLSTSENGVRIQIWCALIAYVMLLLIKKELIIDMTKYELLRIIQNCLFERAKLFEFIETVKFRCNNVKSKLQEDRFLW